MPIYEYACKNCDHTLDALQKIDEEPLVFCPCCGKPGLKKLISAPRFRLKGEGWYETDFKKDKQRNVLKSDSEPAQGDKEAAKSGAGDGAKGEGGGKPATESGKSSDTKPGGKVDSA
jgi:putative FmdB family regulatory protein